MGVDHPGGPSKGPETIDKPSTQGSGDKPSAENNGSSSETPRADSLRRSGWKLEGYGETRTEQHGDRDQRNGESSTTGSTGDRQRGPGNPPAETSPKADKEPQAGKSGSTTDDPRTKTAEAAGTDERDRPQGQPPGRETDGRAEPADRAAPAARQYRLPADSPGSPGQPSRLESLARTRELQQQWAAQNTEGTSSGGRPGEARDGKPAAPQEGEPSGEGQSAGQAENGGTGRDAHAEGHGERGAAGGEGVRLDGRPPEAPPADARSASGGSSGGEVPGERDRPASQPSGEQAGGPAPETVRPQDREHPPLPHQDNAAAPADSGTPPGTEQNPPGADKQGTDELGSDAQDADGQGSDTQDAGGQGADQQGDSRLRPEPSAEAGDRTTGPAPTPPDSVHSAPEPSGRDTEPVRETGTNPQAPDEPADNGRTTPPEAPPSAEAGEAGEPAQPGAETREAAPGTTAPDSGTDERGDTDDAPPPSEETDQSAGAPEPPGEHDGDHGKKGQDDNSGQDPDETDWTNPEVPGNPIISNVHTDSRGQVHVEPRYGRENTGEPGTELARPQPETTEPAQLPDREALDPVGAEGGEGGRGELRDPEDDSEQLDYTDSDSERRSRSRDSYRGLVTQADNVKDSADKFTEPAQKKLERVQPTGQLSGARENPDHIKAPDQAPQAGNIAVAALGTAILVTEIGRATAKALRTMRGNDHARN